MFHEVIMGPRRSGKTRKLVELAQADFKAGSPIAVVVGTATMRDYLVRDNGVPEEYVYTLDAIMNGHALRGKEAPCVYIDQVDFLLPFALHLPPDAKISAVTLDKPTRVTNLFGIVPQPAAQE